MAQPSTPSNSNKRINAIILALGLITIGAMNITKSKVNYLNTPIHQQQDANNSHLKFSAQVIGGSITGDKVLLMNTSTQEVLEVVPASKTQSFKSKYGIATINNNGGTWNLTAWSDSKKGELDSSFTPVGQITNITHTPVAALIFIDNDPVPYSAPANVIADQASALIGKQAFGNRVERTISRIQ